MNNLKITITRDTENMIVIKTNIPGEFTARLSSLDTAKRHVNYLKVKAGKEIMVNDLTSINPLTGEIDSSFRSVQSYFND